MIELFRVGSWDKTSQDHIDMSSHVWGQGVYILAFMFKWPFNRLLLAPFDCKGSCSYDIETCQNGYDET